MEPRFSYTQGPFLKLGGLLWWVVELMVKAQG